MTPNFLKILDKNHLNLLNEENEQFLLIQKYEINPKQIELLSDDGLELSFNEKTLIIERLLEAHELAKINVEAGNITSRGFATNICTVDNYWALGTNFNNTRNDISSICGERSAILASYNNALIEFARKKYQNKKFEFKIKYLCMAQSCDLNEIKKSAVPCEDCLSWLNTNRYFDENTIIFSFEKNEEDNLSIRAQKLYKLLPYKNISTSCEKINIENIEYSKSALLAIEKNKIEESQIIELLNCSFEKYQENNFAKVSNQNIVCSILANNKIYSACKIDWTKRWFVEPFEMASYKAIEENKEHTQIQAVCYFGDEYSKNGDLEFNDGVVSVKSLGRIRQKYANSETLLILNLKNKVLVTTIGGYLPQKFEQGYKII